MKMNEKRNMITIARVEEALDRLSAKVVDSEDAVLKAVQATEEEFDIVTSNIDEEYWIDHEHQLNLMMEHIWKTEGYAEMFGFTLEEWQIYSWYYAN